MYKCVHLLFHNELKFNTRIVDFFSGVLNTFLKNYENVFITNQTEVFQSLNEKGVLYDNLKIHCAINKYARDYDWVFIHDLNKPVELLFVKRKYLKKIIWRTWGSDIGYAKRENERFYVSIIKQFINFLLGFRIEQIKMIGVANVVDIISLKECFNKLPLTLKMPYSNSSFNVYDVLASIKNKGDDNKSEVINVMIEHSGYDETQISIMKMLEKYKNEDIHLYLVLSYGKEEYIEQVKEYVRLNWMDKASIITNFMDYNSYAVLLHKMDIAIFDKIQSYALGNISIMTFFKKKIFLNVNGVLKKGFELEHIPFSTTAEIKDMDFEEFCRPVCYPENAGETIIPKGKIGVDRWMEIFKVLK